MSSSYAPCAACKYLRRKCTQECVFAPYFPPDNPQKFINVHKVFGASNVGKILNDLNPAQRNDAVNSLAYEAECRIKDPIYGCVGFVSALQNHLREVHQQIDRAKKELANYIGPAAMQPILNNPNFPQQNFDQSGPGAGSYQGPLMIQEPQQQMAARDQEMLRAYIQQQQQQEQLYLMQQQELYAQQQQRAYLQQQQQQFNDAGDPSPGGFPAGGGVVQPALGFLENQYQAQEQDQNSQQFQIQELLLQCPNQQQQQQQQQQIVQYHDFAAAVQPQGSQSQHQEQRDGMEDERSFGPS